MFSTDFRKSLKYQNSSGGNRVLPCRRKLKVAFRNFANVPKNELQRGYPTDTYQRSQTSAAVEMNSSVFRVITRRNVVWNRRFGTTVSIFNGQLPWD